MHDGHGSVFRNDLVQTPPVGDVPGLQRSPLHRPFVAIDEVVVGHGEVARLGKCFAGMAADVAGSAGD